MPEKDLKNVRIFGILSPDKLDRAADSLGARFLLQDQHNPGTVMAVVYKGAVPDNFKPGTELYAEGSYVAAAGVFQAGGLTTTCPSKSKSRPGVATSTASISFCLSISSRSSR